jgi:hypothetical protein
MSTVPSDLPTYIKQDNYENYNEELNQTLRQWFNSDGFFLPSLTNAHVAAILALVPAVQPAKIWFNTDLGKAQLLVAVGTVETITSV